MSQSWDDKEIALLKKLWNEGRSAKQIAGRLSGKTRSAVLGKVHRLGLTGRAVTSRTKSSHARKTKPAPKPKAKRPASTYVFGSPAAGQFSDEKPEPYVAPVEEIVIPLGERKGLLDLNDGDCRWPIGDPRAEDFHFCAKQKADGLPYCAVHARKAYQPPSMKRAANSNTAVAGGQTAPASVGRSQEDEIAASGLRKAKEDA